MGLPAHPITKAYKNSENAPHKVLIIFCELLELHPYELMRDYQLGILRISDTEKSYHQKGYHASNNN